MRQEPQVQAHLKGEQKLIMSCAMEKALLTLQLPICELSCWLEKEIEENPVLEISSPSNSSSSLIDFEPSIPSKITRSEYLEWEIRDHFKEEREREVARYIAGCLDERGFFTSSEREVCTKFSISPQFLTRVLHKFHQIEPIGMGARSFQDSLLIQLKVKKREGSLFFQIIRDHFKEIEKGKWRRVAKKFSLSIGGLKSHLKRGLKELNLFPGREFCEGINRAIIPDLIFEKGERGWEVEVNQSPLPLFRVAPFYSESLDHFCKGELDFIRRRIAAGKWLMRILHRRSQILLTLGKYLLEHQLPFLENQTCSPAPMTMREVARALEINESTMTRVIANKYLFSPRGVLKMRDLFTRPIHTPSGEMSNQKAKNLLVKLIDNEDKKHPLSDRNLSEKLLKEGIPCARRTVTKYRQQLRIECATKRRE